MEVPQAAYQQFQDQINRYDDASKEVFGRGFPPELEAKLRGVTEERFNQIYLNFTPWEAAEFQRSLQVDPRREFAELRTSIGEVIDEFCSH